MTTREQHSAAENDFNDNAAALKSPVMIVAPEIFNRPAPAMHASCKTIAGDGKTSQTFGTSREIRENLLKSPTNAGNLRNSLGFSVIQAISA